MKKTLSTLVLLVAFGMLSPSVNAQMQYGGGVFYGSYLGNLGLNLRIEYPITDDLILAPKLDLSIPDFKWGPTFMNEFCGHIHYQVFKTEDLVLYPLAGINIKNYLDFDWNPLDIDLGFGLGVCVGAGGQILISEDITAFGEARYSTGRYHQFMLTGGILFNPKNKSSKN